MDSSFKWFAYVSYKYDFVWPRSAQIRARPLLEYSLKPHCLRVSTLPKDLQDGAPGFCTSFRWAQNRPPSWVELFFKKRGFENLQRRKEGQDFELRKTRSSWLCLCLEYTYYLSSRVLFLYFPTTLSCSFGRWSLLSVFFLHRLFISPLSHIRVKIFVVISGNNKYVYLVRKKKKLI